jgi:hypothetical protein
VNDAAFSILKYGYFAFFLDPVETIYGHYVVPTVLPAQHYVLSQVKMGGRAVFTL